MQSTKRNIAKEFVSFFTVCIKLDNIQDIQGYLLRFGLTYLQSYVEFCKYIVDDELKLTWNCNIKSVILEKFPIKKTGVFSVNADIEILIKEVEKINFTSLKQSIEEEKDNQNTISTENPNTEVQKDNQRNTSNNDNEVNKDKGEENIEQKISENKPEIVPEIKPEISQEVKPEMDSEIKNEIKPEIKQDNKLDNKQEKKKGKKNKKKGNKLAKLYEKFELLDFYQDNDKRNKSFEHKGNKQHLTKRFEKMVEKHKREIEEQQNKITNIESQNIISNNEIQNEIKEETTYNINNNEEFKGTELKETELNEETEVKEPEYKESEYKEPEYKEPEYKEPEYKEPEYKEPKYKEPEYKEPEYKEPEYKEPEYKETEYKEPEYKDINNTEKNILYDNKINTNNIINRIEEKKNIFIKGVEEVAKPPIKENNQNLFNKKGKVHIPEIFQKINKPVEPIVKNKVVYITTEKKITITKTEYHEVKDVIPNDINTLDKNLNKPIYTHNIITHNVITKNIESEAKNKVQNIIPSIKPEIKPNISSIKPNISSFKPNINDIKPNISSIKPNINDIKPNISSIKPNISSLKPNINDIKPNISSIKPNISSIKPTITSIKPNIIEVKPNISSIKPTITSIKPNIIEVKPNISSIKPTITSIKPNIIEVKPNISSIKPNISSIQPNISSIKPNINNIKPNINEVKPNISSLKPNINNIKPNINEVKPNEPLKDANKSNNNEGENKTVKEMTRDYVEESEKGNVIQQPNGEIKLMDLDLLLKYIALNVNIQNNIKYVHYFCQQCFSFLDKEILFFKIKNCYKYFKQKAIPFPLLKYLIFFFNYLVIEMFGYYHSFPPRERYYEVIKQLLKEFSTDISELFAKKGTNKGSNSNVNVSTNPLVNSSFSQRLKMFEANQNVSEEKKIEEKKDEKKDKKEEKKDKKDKKEKEEKKEGEQQLSQEEIEKMEREDCKNEVKKIMMICDFREKIQDISTFKKNTCFYKLKKKLKAGAEKKGKKKKSASSKASAPNPKNEKQEKPEKPLKKDKEFFFFSVNDWEPKEIGEVLLNISKAAVNKIERRELYKAIFLKDTKNKTSPNVMECIEKSNRLTAFIMNEILSYDLPKDRAREYEGWIKVAEYLKTRRDHNDCVAIFSALNHFTIANLELTQKAIKSKAKSSFKNFSEFCTFEGNYKNIRDDMMNAIEKNEFYVPYLGMLLKDISFLDSNPYVVDKHMINMEKIVRVQKRIDKFFKYKKFEDKLENTNTYSELNFFHDLENIPESKLEEISNKLEPEFTLYEAPKKEKRRTKIDIKYFKEPAAPKDDKKEKEDDKKDKKDDKKDKKDDKKDKKDDKKDKKDEDKKNNDKKLPETKLSDKKIPVEKNKDKASNENKKPSNENSETSAVIKPTISSNFQERLHMFDTGAKKK